MFAGQVSDLGPWLEDASINRDSNLRLQYLAGMGLNLYEADVIFNNMVSSGVQFPENLFTGSAGAMQALAGEVQVRQGR